MAVMSRANLLKELLPGLNALFGLEYEGYENEHADIYETENSDRSFEEEVKLSGFGAAPVKQESLFSVTSLISRVLPLFPRKTPSLGLNHAVTCLSSSWILWPRQPHALSLTLHSSRVILNA